jgi:HPt (histidine-containing phosphotransfer) domain-containing protein
MSFLVTFTSLLGPRIDRIDAAFEQKDREELITALLSLHASSAMAGAQRLQATTAHALAAEPVEDQAPDPVLERLAVEAREFEEAARAYLQHEEVPTRTPGV